MKKDHLRLALKGVGSKKLRSWLTMIGIFIGVAAVVALIGLGDGLQLAITSQFGISSTKVLSVQAGGLSSAGPPGAGVVNPLTTDDVDAISKITGVDAVVSRLVRGGMLEYNDKAIIAFSTSIPEDPKQRELVYKIVEIKPEAGRLLRDGDSTKVVLGYNFYTKKGELGKTVRLGDKITFSGQEFEVVGFLKKKGSFIFDNIVLVKEDALRKATHIDNKRVDVIAVNLKSSDVMDSVKVDIEKVLRKRRNVKIGEEDFEVQTPQAILSTVNDVLFGVKVFVVIIASISIIVGALGIINTMLTAVLERRGQIGIMKAIGARNSDIFFLFFFESGLLGLIGGGVGVLIGSIASYSGTILINSFVGSSAAPKINIILITAALFGSFVIGSLAGIIPAMRAAKQHPVDALRG